MKYKIQILPALKSSKFRRESNLSLSLSLVFLSPISPIFLPFFPVISLDNYLLYVYSVQGTVMDNENKILDKTEPLSLGSLLSGGSKGAVTSSRLNCMKRTISSGTEEKKSG